MTGTPMFYRENGNAVARDEWNNIRLSDSTASDFLLARIKQVALASDSYDEARCDLYTRKPDIYCYVYRNHYAIYYAICANQVVASGLDIVVLVCGDISSHKLTLDQYATARIALL